MFENDEDIDVDDEFLNIAFENEERCNNNKPSISGDFNNHSVSTSIESLKNQPHNESFHSRHDSSSSSSGNHFPEIRHFEQGNSGSFMPNWAHTSTERSCVTRDQSLGNNHVGDKENKRKASPPPSRSKRERKFPGPAGLLPERTSLRGSPFKVDGLTEVESPAASTADDLCSQGRLSGSVLEEGPWQSLLADLGSHAELLDTVNVASVKRKAAARCFVGRKLPWLAAVLHHLDVSSADPCIILRDRTGEIHGTLHREVWQQFAAELVVGSVLVIRNVGLLSTGLSSRRHYLNITANNLATIYSANPDKPNKRELHSLTSHDYKRTVEHWQSLAAAPRVTGSPASPLFNTSLPSPCSSSAAVSPMFSDVQPHNGLVNKGLPCAAIIRPTALHNNQRHGSLPGTPSYPRANPPRPTGKILFPSFPNSHSSNCIGTNNSSSPTTVRPPHHNSVNQTNPNISRGTLNNSFQIHSAQNPNAKNVQRTNGSGSNFKFDPVMVKTKTSNNTIKFPNNFENHSTSRNSYRTDSILGNNISRITLSQSSQLTVEEQSVVESVFDGIDADSLFDDDF